MPNCPKLWTLYRICPDLTSRSDKMQLITLTFLLVRDAFYWAQNAPNPDPAAGAYDAPPEFLDGEGDAPSPYLSPLDIFGISKSVPNLYHRFMVTLGSKSMSDRNWHQKLTLIFVLFDSNTVVRKVKCMELVLKGLAYASLLASVFGANFHRLLSVTVKRCFQCDVFFSLLVLMAF